MLRAGLHRRRGSLFIESNPLAPFPQRTETMRAEAEALTQSIKQSMGLLRRHL